MQSSGATTKVEREIEAAAVALGFPRGQAGRAACIRGGRVRLKRETQK